MPDLSYAMLQAIQQSANRRCLSHHGNKLSFNGFWRSGNNQNVCAWLDKATWHDIKTGHGGGCKEFAKVAFNMTLPQFMLKFGNVNKKDNNDFLEDIDIAAAFAGAGKEHARARPELSKPVDDVWQALSKNTNSKTDPAAEWLSKERGFEEPRRHLGSGFANLSEDDIKLFEPIHHSLIKQRLALSPQLVVPIRGVHSDAVKNLFFRSMGKVDKSEKTRLLTGAGGWKDPDESPRAFGFPHLIEDFPNLVLFEGMADYFAGEALLAFEEKWLPIGASNAEGLNKWALWLSKSKYSGQVVIVYQLDPDSQGELTAEEIGPSMAVKAMQTLKDSSIRARFFNWQFYLNNTTSKPETISDIADSIQQESLLKECGPGHLNYCFKIALTLEKGF